MRHWALRNVGIRGLLLGSLLLAGCASSMVTMERHRERAVAPLQRQSDADSLAAAGLFQVPKNRAQALDLLARAEAAEPTRPDLVWLRLQVCQAETSCDPQPEAYERERLVKEFEQLAKGRAAGRREYQDTSKEWQALAPKLRRAIDRYNGEHPQVQAALIDKFSRTPVLEKSLGAELKQHREQVRDLDQRLSL